MKQAIPPSAAQEPNSSSKVIPMNVVVNNEDQYTIPLRFRKMENLHIVFWLFKDLAWCLGITYLAVGMIIPTMIISILIAWRTRKMVSELCHNMAIAIWISANSFWMISEFFHFDTVIAFGGITYKHLAVIPFVIGLMFLGYYYIWYAPRNKNHS